jgi:hypothetical protein
MCAKHRYTIEGFGFCVMFSLHFLKAGVLRFLLDMFANKAKQVEVAFGA